jgi:hypothetical protein
LGPSKDEQVRRSICRRWSQREKFRPDWNPRDLSIAEPFGGGRKVDGGRLDTLAYQAIRHPRHRVGLESHRRNAAQDGCAHGRTRGISSNSENDVGTELANDPGTGKQGQWQLGQGTKARGQGDLIQRANFNELQRKSSVRDHARLQAARGSDEEDLGMVPDHKFACDSEGWNDVTTGTATGDENARKF